MKSNEKNIKEFTDSLYELFVEQNIPLNNCLEIMAFEKKSKFEKACAFIQNELLNGNSFSNSLKSCEYLDFDAIYISFVAFSEITGNLGETLKFLKKRCERKESNRNRLIDASVYPCFVVVFACVLCVFIAIYGKDLFGAEIEKITKGSVSEFYEVFIFFATVIFGGFAFIQNSLRENLLYESFLAIDFLIKSGVQVASAIGAGIIICGPESKNGIYFQKIKEKLEYGMDIYTAFNEIKINSFAKNTLYYAKKGGEKNDLFGRIALKMGIEDEKKRKRCLNLLEPFFIGITGLFLVMMMIIYVMPFFMDTSWVLL